MDRCAHPLQMCGELIRHDAVEDNTANLRSKAVRYWMVEGWQSMFVLGPVWREPSDPNTPPLPPASQCSSRLVRTGLLTRPHK